MGKMAEPPAMVGTDLTTAPFGRGDGARLAAEIREPIPRITARRHGAGIAPIIVFEAVGRKMDVSTLCHPRMGFVVANEPLP